MKIKEMEVKVNNVSEGKYKFVVARLVSGELWYLKPKAKPRRSHRSLRTELS